MPEEHLDGSGTAIERVVVNARHVLEIVLDAGGTPRRGAVVDGALEVILAAREEAEPERRVLGSGLLHERGEVRDLIVADGGLKGTDGAEGGRIAEPYAERERASR